MKVLWCALFLLALAAISIGREECTSCHWYLDYPYCAPDGSHWSNEDSDCRAWVMNNIPRCMEYPNLMCDQGGAVPVP